MKIQMHEISIKDVVEGYEDKKEEGVKAYKGFLDVRPPYQREFIYKEEQQQAVITTVLNGFPLNVMYWVKNGESSFEVLDGQQRTLSICNYVSGGLGVKIDKTKNIYYFNNLSNEKKEQILNYRLMVYFCEGENDEKLQWFKTVNIAGERLFDQELRNAVYTGEWLYDAKGWFSKSTCQAIAIGKIYLQGSPIRQDYLETALKWVALKDNLPSIEAYMALHQHDKDATPLWEYFRSVINWVKDTFSTYRPIMKGLDWGTLYNENKDRKDLDATALEKDISKLLQDEDVTNKKGVYLYVLDKNEKHLSIRAFLQRDKVAAYERQQGKCAICGKTFKIEEMQADHKIAWSKGGKTTSDNCQLLCTECNLKKSDM